MTSRYLLWDFDGTLAHREGLWGSAVRDAIHRLHPERAVTTDSVRPFLQSGFPWHTPGREHCYIESSVAWWAELEPVFTRVLDALDIKGIAAADFVQAVKEEYLDVAHWNVTDGAFEVLQDLAAQEWRHVIISNHVPELNDLVFDLGLTPFFEATFSSAEIGFEKPNTNFLGHVFSQLSAFDKAWVIGDSVKADVAAASAAGLPSVLVGSSHDSADHCVDDLYDIAGLLDDV